MLESKVVDIFELRKIYGSYGLVKDQNRWRIRINDKLQVMYRRPNTVTTQVRRQGWAGHVRMSDGGTVKKVFVGKPNGRRGAGRSKLRRLDCIDNDLK